MHILSTATAKGLVLVGGVLHTFFISNFFGIAQVGEYALAHGALILLAAMARMGMDRSLVRFVGRAPDQASAIILLGYSLVRAALLSSALASTLFVVALFIVQLGFRENYFLLAPYVCVSLPALTVCGVFSGYWKAIGRPVLGVLSEIGSYTLVAAILMPILLLGMDDFTTTVGYSLVSASFALFLLNVLVLTSYELPRSLARKIRSLDRALREEYQKASKHNLVTTMVGLTQGPVLLLLTGVYFSEEEVGWYRIALQLGLLVCVGNQIVNYIYPPLFARHHYEGDRQKLRATVRTAAVLSASMALPFLLLVVFASSQLLVFFGIENLGTVQVMLWTICLGSFVSAVCGPMANLLYVSGHERVARNVVLLSSIAILSLALLFFPNFSIVTAAVLFSLALIFSNGAYWWIARKLVLDT